MIRAEFNFNKNGISAKGFFTCIVTSLEKMTFYPVDCFIQELKFSCKGFPDFEKIKNECWENSIAQIY